jgi:hypothetical protein
MNAFKFFDKQVVKKINLLYIVLENIINVLIKI